MIKKKLKYKIKNDNFYFINNINLILNTKLNNKYIYIFHCKLSFNSLSSSKLFVLFNISIKFFLKLSASYSISFFVAANYYLSSSIFFVVEVINFLVTSSSLRLFSRYYFYSCKKFLTLSISVSFKIREF